MSYFINEQEIEATKNSIKNGILIFPNNTSNEIIINISNIFTPEIYNIFEYAINLYQKIGINISLSTDDQENPENNEVMTYFSDPTPLVQDASFIRTEPSEEGAGIKKEFHLGRDSNDMLSIVVHEIGHVLGLEHTGNYNGADYHYDLESTQRGNKQFSIMSYGQPGILGPFIPNPIDDVNTVFELNKINPHADGSFISPMTLMVADLEALKELYGIESINTENNIYNFNGHQSFDIKYAPAYTIYDNGGIDTVDFTVFGGNWFNFIDMREGHASSVGGWQNNVFIGFDTKIEKTIGSDTTDIIEGSLTGEEIQGQGGHDIISANGGSDVIFSGNGNDIINGGSSVDEHDQEDTDTVNYEELHTPAKSLTAHVGEIETFVEHYIYTEQYGRIQTEIDTLKNIEHIRFGDQDVQLHFASADHQHRLFTSGDGLGAIDYTEVASAFSGVWSVTSLILAYPTRADFGPPLTTFQGFEAWNAGSGLDDALLINDAGATLVTRPDGTVFRFHGTDPINGTSGLTVTTSHGALDVSGVEHFLLTTLDFQPAGTEGAAPGTTSTAPVEAEPAEGSTNPMGNNLGFTLSTGLDADDPTQVERTLDFSQTSGRIAWNAGQTLERLTTSPNGDWVRTGVQASFLMTPMVDPDTGNTIGSVPSIARVVGTAQADLFEGLDGQIVDAGAGDDRIEVRGASGARAEVLHGGNGSDTFRIDVDALIDSQTGGLALYGGTDGTIWDWRGEATPPSASGYPDTSIDTLVVEGGSALNLNGDAINGHVVEGFERVVFEGSVDDGTSDWVTRTIGGSTTLRADLGAGSDTWTGTLTGDTVEGGTGTVLDTLILTVASDTLVYDGRATGAGIPSAALGVWGRWSMPGEQSPGGEEAADLVVSGFEVVSILGEVSTFQATFAVPPQAMRFAFEAFTQGGTGAHLDLSDTVPTQRLFIDGRGVGTGGAAPGVPTTTVQALLVSGTTVSGTGLAWTLEGVDRITGGLGADVLTAGAGQTIEGGGGADRLVLGLGDTAIGGEGADQFFWSPLGTATPMVQTIKDGEVGLDTVLVRRSGSTVVNPAHLAWTEELDEAGAWVGTRATHTPSGRALVLDGLDVPQAQSLLLIERVGDWIGTPGNDTQTGFSAGIRAFGLGGNDVLTTNGGGVTLYGGDGNDTLKNNGGSGTDTATLFGGAGNDTFWTHDNKFTATTTISYADVPTPVAGGIGGANGVVITSAGKTTQDGFGGEDTIHKNFGAGFNVIVGSKFHDSMSTISHTIDTISAMRLDGGNGNDTLSAAGYNDDLFGGAGDDVLSARSGQYTGYFLLSGGADNDTITNRSSHGNTTLDGGSGDDVLDGRTGGQDALWGGAGIDILRTGASGSLNFDTLSGGADADLFAFTSNSSGFGRTATITDFQAGLDQWTADALFAAAHIHTNPAAVDFGKIRAWGTGDVAIGGSSTTPAVIVKNATVQQVRDAFVGTRSDPTSWWESMRGLSGAAVSSDGDGAQAPGGGATSPVIPGSLWETNPFYAPDDGENAPLDSGGVVWFAPDEALPDAEWVRVLDAMTDDGAGLGLGDTAGATGFLFEDPAEAWLGGEVMPLLDVA